MIGLGEDTLFNILVVDDEQIERDGIKFLIKKYNLELNILEAENGEEAVEVIKEHPVDILFTDIKMPFMDGLELCKNARELTPNIKIIIFSAYGDFEYAKKAIDFNISHYILKPIDVAEFLQVTSKVMELCKSEKETQEKSLKLLEGYRKGIEYEKEKLLLDLINSGGDIISLEERMEFAGLNFSDKLINMLLIDYRTKFFDLNNSNFHKMIKDIINWNFEYVNLNENQSLIFVMCNKKDYNRYQFYELGDKIKDKVSEVFERVVTVIVGKAVLTVKELSEEFNRMEGLLEYKFFFNESMVFFTDKEYAHKSLSQETADNLMDVMHKSLECKDYFGFLRGVDLFFNSIYGNEHYSEALIKYICTDLVKKTLESNGKLRRASLLENVDKISNCKSLAELKAYINTVVDKVVKETKSESHESSKKVIKDIVKIIEANYMKDISLEWIAEKVYLSPSYLSYLFRKEMEQSLVKYINVVRMEKAKELLKSSNMKISDISERVGFSNYSYFCLSFKNYFGISAAKLRESKE